MIAKAKSIPHGHANLSYIMGESKREKHAGEKIRFVTTHGLDPFHRSAEAWEEMKRACRGHPEMKNTVIRVIISPDKKDAENFTIQDWEKLWLDFIEAFDTLDHRNDEGEQISKPTNLRNSIYTVHVHYDSKSGVPHLHGAVCRVDGNGATNPDGNIHLRAHAAADIINMQRGWSSPQQIRNQQLKRLNALCTDILRRMPRYTLAEFHNRLRASGYEVLVNKDRSGMVRGHSIKKGSCHYKMSEIGRGFTVSKLPDTWQKLHKSESRNITPEVKFNKRTGDAKPDMSAFTQFKPGRVPYDLVGEYRPVRLYLPQGVIDLFNDEFDHRSINNSDDMISTAASLFVGILLPPSAPHAGTGGGASDNNLPWGRDPKEDEIEWAKRCAKMAKHLVKPQPSTKFRR